MSLVTVQASQNTIIGTGQFRFLAGTALPSTPNLPAGYLLDFGEAQYTLKSAGELKELWLAQGGVLGKSKKKTVKPTVMIERDLQYLPPEVLGIFAGTPSTGGTPSFGKIVEGFGYFAIQMEDENVVGGSNSNAGTGIFVYHSFACDVLINGDMSAKGDDFESMKLSVEVMLGRAKGTVVIGTRPITAVP